MEGDFSEYSKLSDNGHVLSSISEVLGLTGNDFKDIILRSLHDIVPHIYKSALSPMRQKELDMLCQEEKSQSKRLV